MTKIEDVLINSEQGREALRPLVDAVAANADAIVKLTGTGEIAILAVTPNQDWCRALGLPHPTKVALLQLPPANRRAMIERGNAVTSRWLRGGRTGRLFAVLHAGTFLLNLTESGWELEPGSLEAT